MPPSPTVLIALRLTLAAVPALLVARIVLDLIPQATP